MPAAHRLTTRSAAPDPRSRAIVSAAAAYGIDLSAGVSISDIVFVEGDLDQQDRAALVDFLVDPLLQTATWDDGDGIAEDSSCVWEIALHPGVTDATSAAVLDAARQLGVEVTGAATGRQVRFPSSLPAADAELVVRSIIANPVIERWAHGPITPVFHPSGDAAGKAAVVPIADLDAAALEALNRERGLALDPAELATIQRHFGELGRDPTDAELETLAQTWSEHCAHKTFRAGVIVDGVERPGGSLLEALRATTESIDAPFVRSSFVGNAGIISFGGGLALSLKAETHNHPSAIEPFGGANTGVGGVIRDIIGAGHKPIAVTDVLCFAPPELSAAAVPAGTLHPRLVADGVIAGVADYGNKVGLPTVAGAILYDRRFVTNPLVFCGCIGAAPDVDAPRGPFLGDRILVLGGATGRDGIRGATFSSLEMDATSGEVAGASVQIGDPITEKLVADALHHLSRAGVDGRPLWTAITDCGAGGLSSAIGEMAETLGADVELAHVPLKYPGLEPWEVWLSEAQERMVVAVDPSDAGEFAARCARFGVTVTDVGAFTGSGRLVVNWNGQRVIDLDTAFLHDGRPRRRMPAVLPTPPTVAHGRQVDDEAAALLALLAHPNIASKAAVIQRYDHVIGGATVVGPVLGDHQRGHADGVVLAEPAVRDGLIVPDPTAVGGIAIGIGVNPWYGLADPQAMAEVAVDEAIRNVVAVGADPTAVALLDNFSWGDPADPTVFGALVAAVDGCCRAAAAFGAPFVSGKDSLNNTYTDRDGARHAIPPTLVITAVARVPDTGRVVTPELTTAGNKLVLVGTTGEHFAGCHLDMVAASATLRHDLAEQPAGITPQPVADAPERYRRLHSAILDGTVRACHDISEGGLAVALAEMCIAAGLGATVDDLGHDDRAAALFSESAGRFVVEVAPQDVDAFVSRIGTARVIGTVASDPVLDLAGTRLAVAELATAFGATPPAMVEP